MSDDQEITGAELLEEIHAGWDELQAYLATLSPAQMTGPTDAAGWTVKDHLMHLALWESGVVGLFRGEVRYEVMGLDSEAWASGDFDHMNAIMRDQTKNLPLNEVLQRLRDTHAALVAQVESMSDQAINLPYRHYQAYSQGETPIHLTIMNDTFLHYAEHRPWIEAIVAQAAN